MTTNVLVELLRPNGLESYRPSVWWTGKFLNGGHEWTNNLFDARRFQTENDAQHRLAELGRQAQAKLIDASRLRFVVVDFEQFP